jgi:hypothetical protein
MSMFKRITPLFSPDDGGSIPAAPEASGWGNFISSELANYDSTSADDVQPETDTDAQGDEGAEEPPAEGQDEVEPNPDDAEPAPEGDDKKDPNKPEPLSDDTEIELGEDRQPVKLAELKQGYLRQSDYTKKTQALADERKAFETERQHFEPVKQWLDYINGNPWLFQQINTAIREFNSTGVLPIEEVMQDAQYGRYINHLMAENNRLQSQLGTLQAEKGEIEFSTTMNGVIGDLKTEYGDLLTPEYEQQLRDQAKADGLKPEVVKKMAKGDLAEQKLQQEQAKSKKAGKEAEARTIQKLQEKRNALPPQPRSSAQRPADEAPEENMSWFDLAKLAGGRK